MKITAKEIKIVEIEKLKPYINNPRINEHVIDQIVNSIEKFGFVNPIIVRKKDNMVIAGHARLKAVKKMGGKTVPVVFVDFSENDAKLYNIADNKLGELADWDMLKLADILEEFKGLDIDINVLGFSDKELDNLFKDIEIPEFDENIETKNVCPKCGYEW